MVVGDEVKLSQALERYLGEAWARLVALKGDEGRALEALDHPDPGFISFYRQQNLELNLGSPEHRKEALLEEEVAALTSKMTADLRDLGAKGRIEARGLYVGTGLRQAIPAELWASAEFNFATQSVKSREFAYQHVTVKSGAEYADSESCLRAWLEKRRDKRGEEHKKALQQGAEEEFGKAFRVRAFDEAYRAIYRRARGRPRKRK